MQFVPVKFVYPHFCNIVFIVYRPIDAAEMQLLLQTQDGKMLRFIAAPVVEVQADSTKAETKESTKKEAIVSKNSSESKAMKDQKLCAAKMVIFY